MHDNDFNIEEFTAIAGISRQRLYQLWRADRGPLRNTRRLGKARRVAIPRRSGLVWLFARYPERARGYVRSEEALWTGVGSRLIELAEVRH